MIQTYRIADKNIEIRSVYDEVHEYCRDYLTDGNPDFFVETTKADIDYEREWSLRSAAAEGRAPQNSSDSGLEELAVYRIIAEKMPEYNTFLFHGSALSVNGEGILFAAPSGTGKSTHAALWRKAFGDEVVMVNDDKPLIRVEEEVTVFGTPYNGKHRLGLNISVPLKALGIIERSLKNSVQKVTKEEIKALYPRFLQQMYRPADPAMLSASIELLDRMLSIVPVYRIFCNMEPEAAIVCREETKVGNGTKNVE